jgi:hypothetical protein
MIDGSPTRQIWYRKPTGIGRARRPSSACFSAAGFGQNGRYRIPTALKDCHYLAEGEKDLLEVCVSLRLVLALEGVECLMN